MNALLNAASDVNGNHTINGRGLPHLKLTDDELVGLAADMATGQRPFHPSVAQTTLLTGVSATKIRAEINVRCQRDELGRRHGGRDHHLEPAEASCESIAAIA
jgi:hypothetical protein